MQLQQTRISKKNSCEHPDPTFEIDYNTGQARLSTQQQQKTHCKKKQGKATESVCKHLTNKIEFNKQSFITKKSFWD